MHRFEEVITGISKYINNEIYPNMNDWQEIIARLAVGRIINDEGKLKEVITQNAFIRTFGIVDEDGMVDVETIAKEIKSEIAKKGKLTFSVPMFGNISFSPTDVDILYRTITNQQLI